MSRYSKSDRDIFMEVLKPSMGAGAYIKDFRKSDAPQFKGKTEKERDKMAVAAYLDAKDEMDENVKTVAQNLNIDKKDVDKLKALMVMYTRAMKLPAGSPAQEKFTKEITKLRKELNMEDTVEWNGEELVETKLPPHLAKLFDKDGNFKDKKKQARFDKMQKAARKGIKFTSKDVTPKGYGPEEGIEEAKKPSMQSLFALIADTKNAQEGIAKIMKALKVDEKKASVMMDKLIAYALKKEELEEHHEKDENGNVIEHCLDCNCDPCTCQKEEIEEDYVITLKGKEVSRHKKENDARSAWHKLRKQHGNDVKVTKEGVELDEAKYDLYHKDFSSAMQHAYAMAKKLHGITIDPKEIDNKVATGPRKPGTGKTNTYRLKGDKGNIQIQVYNKGGSKPFELNMYKEEVELDERAPKMKYALVGKDMKIYSMGSDERDLKLDRRSLEQRFKDAAPLKIARLKTAQSIGDKVDKSQLKEDSFYKKITGVDSLRESRAKRDAMRAMGRRRGKDPADIDTDASDDDVKAASKNIIMQLRKAVSMKGDFNVEFEKEKKKVPANVAQAVLDKHARMRTSMDKGAFEKTIRKSYRDLLNAVKGK